jgi:hypothetical protein
MLNKNRALSIFAFCGLFEAKGGVGQDIKGLFEPK